MPSGAELDILKIFGQIAAPAGVAIGAFLYIGRDILAKNIFPTVTKDHAYRIIIAIALMAWSIALAGIGSWTYVEAIAKKEKDEKSKQDTEAPITKMQKELLERIRLATERAQQAALRAREAESEADRYAAIARSSPTSELVVNVYKWDGGERRYEGQWASGKSYGFGVMTWSGTTPSTGEKFAGQHIDGKRALGVFSYPPIAANTSEVKRYEGQWSPTTRSPAGGWNGYGVIKYRDGSIYSGEVIDGERQGIGSLTDAKGYRFEGRWTHDALDEIDRIQKSNTGKII